MRLKVKAPAILDFDTESRPLSYMGGDLTTCEITAIAAGWAAPGNDHIDCWMIGEVSPVYMLTRFHLMYDAADIVTGHYIRNHDLPLLNGAMVEFNLPPLGAKMTIDTKNDLVKWNFQTQGKSQEALGRTLGIEAPKVGMSQADWRAANRLTPEGLEKTRARCAGDVQQHKQLRLALTERGLLNPPKIWSP